ncbi:3-hydroxyanthranilic acid dioxygenase [Kalaharituber pfeilii]|nr:3-hydroxyanthranilic acid dioxygenase [Kalaharituber pfeilii]
MTLPTPLNLPKWLSENSHLLSPPINNFCVYDAHGITVMVVGGPNARSDYHINTTPEWFFQYHGAMLLKVVENPDSLNPLFKDIHIGEGEMLLLPPNTPHNPIRFANTVGIVIEQHRPAGSVDKLRWYCPNVTCRKVVYEASFHCTDLGTQVKAAVQEFAGKHVEERRCKACMVGIVGEQPDV